MLLAMACETGAQEPRVVLSVDSQLVMPRESSTNFLTHRVILTADPPFASNTTVNVACKSVEDHATDIVMPAGQARVEVTDFYCRILIASACFQPSYPVTFSGTVAADDSIVVQSATMRVVDDPRDHPQFRARVEPARISESAGAREFTVSTRRVGGDKPCTEAVTSVEVVVDETPQPGTVDFTVSNRRLTFKGSGTGSFTVTPENDDEDERDRHVTVSGEAVMSGGMVPFASQTFDLPATEFVIEDDDEVLPRVSVADAEAAEGDGNLAFVAMLDTAASTPVAVDYATADATAVAGEDYESVSGRLEFMGGELTRTVLVPIVDDAADEADETLLLKLSNASGATLSTAEATGTILDNDETPPPPALPVLSVAGGRGTEGGTVRFQVTLSASSEDTVTVSYTTSDGTAVAGEDYEAVRGTLTFAPGETWKAVPVRLLDDDVDEPDETFVVRLGTPTNAGLSVAAATGTILDDDEPACDAPSPGRVLLFEPSLHAHRQGFVRLINHSPRAGEVLVEAIDDSGMRYGPVPLSIGAGAAAHFNSDDLEAGNAGKGLPDGIGASGAGVWRLELTSGLDIEVLAYMRTRDGFVTALHDTAPATSGVHRAVFLNPGGNVDQVSRLRLANWGAEAARITISGTDDMGGASPEVAVDVPAGSAREWTAAELESGVGAEGALGDGEGKWRLRVASNRPVAVLSLIENPTGHLTNLSTLPRIAGRAEDSHVVPLFPSASDPLGRQGFVRVANPSEEPVNVRIEAFDGSGWVYDPIMLAVDAGEAASFNSDDLELGNPAKGLTGATGAGEGDWWLELSGAPDIGVGSYVRTADGFLTSMHDLAPEWDGGYRVVFFNPAENPNQVSVLWLVNPGDEDAHVNIVGVDDRDVTPGTTVRTTVAAGSSRRLNSTELETGESGAIESGALGDGAGKWRLRVDSDRPIRVMSLIENPTGHLTNLSTAPACRPPPGRASGP